jgi:phosphoesterase RecJ-like protein
MAIAWSRFKAMVDAGKRFVITSHVRPDGDSIGSELGTAAMLDQLGKQTTIANASTTPPRYGFLDPQSRIRHLGTQVTLDQLEGADTVIIVDTSAWEQLGGMSEFVRRTTARKIVVDHHVSEDDLGAEMFKDTGAAACGEILAEAVEALGCRLTREIAEPLFVAMATDTGWFRFSSTDGRVLRTAARLVEAGLEVDRLYRRLFEESSLARLKLMGRVLNSLQVTAGGRLAWSWVSLDDLRATGAIPQDTEDLVNYTLTIAGTEIGLMFLELRDSRVKVSFRAKGGIDCTRLAGPFGGGGHREAAGCTIQGTLAQAQDRVLQVATAALQTSAAAAS